MWGYSKVNEAQLGSLELSFFMVAIFVFYTKWDEHSVDLTEDLHYLSNNLIGKLLDYEHTWDKLPFWLLEWQTT